MEVTRFEWGRYGGMSELEDGDWVRYSDHLASCGATVQALQARIVELEEASRWIPVTERLPDFSTMETIDDGDAIYVLVVRKERPSHVFPAVYMRSGGFMRRSGFSDYVWMGHQDVTHWQPLPKEPK